jgi:hypothetical protein
MGMHWKDGGYSASVEVYVIFDGQRIEVAEIGPESMVLRNHERSLRGPAEIVIEVDGQKEIHNVILCRHDTESSVLEFV